MVEFGAPDDVLCNGVFVEVNNDSKVDELPDEAEVELFVKLAIDGVVDDEVDFEASCVEFEIFKLNDVSDGDTDEEEPWDVVDVTGIEVFVDTDEDVCDAFDTSWVTFEAAGVVVLCLFVAVDRLFGLNWLSGKNKRNMTEIVKDEIHAS